MLLESFRSKQIKELDSIGFHCVISGLGPDRYNGECSLIAKKDEEKTLVCSFPQVTKYVGGVIPKPEDIGEISM